MTPTREEVIAAARKCWGPENPKFTKRDELRWGNNGAICLDLNKLVWSDHDPTAPVKGGGWTDLFKMAGIKFNGHDDEWGAETVYPYIDEHNKLLFEVVRRPGHKFSQRSYDEHGNVVKNIKNVRRVLYRLPQLKSADAQTDTVFIVEGEKDADNLAKLGFVTTTNPGGAGKWREEYNEALEGFDVVILPDNDEAGRAHADIVENWVSKVAHSLKIVALPGLGEKEDVSDWIARGGTAETLRELVAAAPARSASNNQSAQAAGGWLNLCQRTTRGEPLANVTNALIALRNDPKLKELLAYDLLLTHPMVVRSEPQPLSNSDITDIQEHMQLAGLRHMGLEICKQAIVRRAKENSYHPLIDAWNKLEWDGIERVATFATQYLGTTDTEYHKTVCAMFLRQMVKRVYEPGCKADYMLILEGEQGLEKSRACEILAGGPRYFSDCCPDLDRGKEVSQHLRGKILIEFSEMTLYNRADITHHKEFLSRTHERYRPPYEPAEVEEPRQCTFIGTSNKSVYLRDETGNRRYWGVAISKKIQIEKLKRDRDQIIAEAIDDYRRGLPTYPDEKTQRDVIEEEQESRYEDDPWTDAVRKYLSGDHLSAKVKLPSATIADIATSPHGLNMPIERVTGVVQSRLSRILRKLQWISMRNKTSRWWEPMHNNTNNEDMI